jgi:hypothetical protein
MSKVTCQIATSLDGYVAGPQQSTDDPLGIGGERLFADVGDPALEVLDAVTSPAAIHIRYRVVR